LQYLLKINAKNFKKINCTVFELFDFS